MIDFTECEEPISDDTEDNLYEMEDRSRKTKRRRTEGDEPSSATRHHTQTLTQLEFFSDPSDERQNQSSNNEFAQDWNVRLSSDIASAAAGNPTIHRSDIPKTPVRSRRYEVLSSQSPATPFSTRGRLSERRFPLAERSINLPVNASPIHASSARKLPKLEIEDNYDFVEDSQERVPSTPAKDTSTAKVSAVSEPYVKIEPSQKRIKVEIEDSEEERDDELEIYNDDFGLGTQVEVGAIPNASELSSSPGLSHVRKEVPQPENQSQPLNNQRQCVSAEDIELMAQRSDKSDIIISIHPNHIFDIINRTKDHEFRTYQIPNQVKRMWIYETAPSSSIKYMASISAAKEPGQISDLRGLGNEEFNARQRGNHYAYEIFQVYELSDPLSLGTLKAKGWIKGPPQKYAYVQPAVLDRLLSNLECSLFKAPPEQSTVQPSVPPNDAQGAETQLQRPVVQSTQTLSSPNRPDHPRLSQATTVALTEASSPPPRPQTAQGQTPARSNWTAALDSVVIPDTPSHQRASSIPHALPPLKMTQQGEQAQDTLVPLPFASSQLLTRSQMLPDSLINDDLPPPPLFVEDSDLEE
jgi:hypothetical protein